MVWDVSQPTDTTKIRNLGVVIRPNWQAIEQADSTFKPQAINFNNRTPLPISNDPTAIADSYILFCKDDTAGNPELFGIDENSVISQFTSTDRTLAQNGYALLPPGFLLQWGRGFIGGGATSVTVNFPKAFSAPCWMVDTTPYGNPITGSSPREWGATNILAASFDGISWNGPVPGAGLSFGWIAVGPA